jgi:membrane-bound serine protease (ClpP class)
MSPPVSAAVRRVLSLAVLVLVGLGLLASSVAAQDVDPSLDAERCPDGVAEDTRTVEVLPLRAGFIDPPVTSQIVEVIDLANDEGSELVVLQYSAQGGVSVDLDDLLGAIDASQVPVAVLIGPLGTGAEAIGAGGLLWSAAHIRAVSSDASVGPIAPVDLAALDDDRGADLLRDRLDAAGVEAAVVDRLLEEPVGAEDLADAGALTLTAQDLEPLLVELDGHTVAAGGEERTLRIRACELEVRFHSLGLVRRLLHAATTGPFIYLLLVVGLGALLFEVFQPGFGVAGLAGLITVAIGGFGLTVLPVTWWAVALVVLGLILYAIDTAIAGFGLLTLAATAAFVWGSLRFYAAETLALNGWLVAATTAVVAAFFVFVMTSILRAQAGPEGVALDDLVGRPGIVRSVLNPEGHVYIDGALWRARWTGDAKRAKVGTPVRVHAVEGPVVLVEPFDPQGGGGSDGGEAHDGDAPPDVGDGVGAGHPSTDGGHG